MLSKYSMLNLPITQMTERISLYGFTYPIEAGAKERSPILKKHGIRCMAQDCPPQLVSWYWQRQELVNQCLFLIDQPDYSLFEINDRVVYEGNNYRVKGRHDLAGRHRVFRIDLAIELGGNN